MVKKICWIIFFVSLAALGAAIIIGFAGLEDLAGFIAPISGGILLIDVVILLFVLNKRFYNTFFYLVGILVIGAFFKFQQWPGAGPMLVVSLGLMSVGSIILSIRSFKLMKDNSFLKWFSFFVNIILALLFWGILCKIMHWPSGSIFSNGGSLFFVIAVLALVFTLPNSNFLNWGELDKKIFYRSIIIPMACTFLFLAWWHLDIGNLTEKYSAPEVVWFMKDFELFPKEGL